MTLSKRTFMRSVLSRGRMPMIRMARYHGISVARMHNSLIAEVLWNLREYNNKTMKGNHA